MIENSIYKIFINKTKKNYFTFLFQLFCFLNYIDTSRRWQSEEKKAFKSAHRHIYCSIVWYDRPRTKLKLDYDSWNKGKMKGNVQEVTG